MRENSSSETKNHLLYQIMSAPIQTYPLIHLRSENVFPEGFYREMVAHLPPREYWQCYPDNDKLRYKERYAIELNGPEGLKSIPEPFQSFWSDFMLWFLSDDFRDQIIEKFRPYLRHLRLWNSLFVIFYSFNILESFP